MSHSIFQLLTAEYIYVQVMSTTIEVSVHSAYQVGNLLIICMTKSARVHGLGIGDTIQRPLVGDLGYGVQRCKKSACLCAVARVCTRCERSPCTSSIRKVTGELTIYNVGSNGQDRGCRLSTTIGVVLLNICDELLQKPYTDLISTVIIVTILREVAFYLEINCQACLRITNNLNLCILDSGQRVDNV